MESRMANNCGHCIIIWVQAFDFFSSVDKFAFNDIVKPISLSISTSNVACHTKNITATKWPTKVARTLQRYWITNDNHIRHNKLGNRKQLTPNLLRSIYSWLAFDYNLWFLLCLCVSCKYLMLLSMYCCNLFLSFITILRMEFW